MSPQPKTSLAQKLRDIQINKSNPKPIWEGPESAEPNGGVTQSLIGTWLCCRERARIKLIEGIVPSDSWSHRLGYGTMWHILEEAHAAGEASGRMVLRSHCTELCKKYRLQQEQIVHWMEVALVEFPIYVNYWKTHSDVKHRTPLLQEQVFHLPYDLPSGRTVYLRGRWDSVDLIGKGKEAGVWLQENKTKGDIDESHLKRQLSSDLQSMFYLIALEKHYEQIVDTGYKRIMGVRYNVVRRPLSGGKGSIKKLQPKKSNPQGESSEEFYARLGEVIKADPSHFFMRWNVLVLPQDIVKFRRMTLDPLLEELCLWYDWVTMDDPFRVGNNFHFQMPFGIYNPLLEGGATDLDEYLATGSMTGLVRTDTLFGELK